MTHTLETLLPLLDKDGNPINQEASDKLRVWAAELDGLTRHDESYPYPKSSNGICKRIVWKRDGEVVYTSDDDLPNYPTSLDAIYAAEKRAGLHDSKELQNSWECFADDLFMQNKYQPDSPSGTFFALLTPAQRTVILILTLQQKQTL